MNRIFITFLLLAFCFSGAVSQEAAKGFKALEKNNYKKAAKVFSEIINLNVNDVAANYGMAIVASEKSSEQYNLYKAYDLISNAVAYYSRLDENQQAQLNSLFSADKLQKKRDNIDDVLFAETVRTNRLPDIKKFIEQCPDTKNMEAAMQQLHKLEFWDVKHENTEMAYNEFLANYPTAKEAAEAKKLRNQLAFQNTKHKGKISDYQEFVKRYPDAEQVPEAKKVLYTMEYKKVKIRNSSEAYQDYLKKYPEAPEAEQARQYVYILEYKKAEADNTLESLSDYIKKYPESPHANKAKALSNKLVEQQINEAFDIDELNNYLLKYRGTKIYKKIFDKKTKLLGDEYLTNNKYQENQPTWKRVFDLDKMKNRASDAIMTSNGMVLAGNSKNNQKWFNNAWIIKTDLEGNLVWEYQFGEELDDAINCIGLTSNNEVIAAGHKDAKGTQSGEVVVFKLDENGKIKWRKSIPGTDALDLAINQSDEIIVGGYTSQENGNRDLWVYKFNHDGAKIWDKKFPRIGIANSVAITPESDIIVLGNEQIMKLTTNGDKIWEKTFNEEIKAHDMSINDYGNVIVTGRSYNFKKETRADFWIAEIAVGTGAITWQKVFDRNNEFDNAFSVSTSPDGIYVAGLSSNANDTDDDIWVLKLDYAGNKTEEFLYGTEKNEKRPVVLTQANGKPIIFTSIGLDADMVLLGF